MLKEFIMKHPILTFLLADTAITGICNTVKYVAAAFGKNQVVEVTEEGKKDEPAGDIQ